MGVAETKIADAHEDAALCPWPQASIWFVAFRLHPTVAVLFVEGILLVYLIGEREYRIFFPATLRQSVSLLTKNRDHLIIIQVIGVTNENLF